MNTRILYADHAAATPLDPAAKAAMEPYWAAEYANPSALYRFGLHSRQAVEQARRQISELLGCPENALYFTSGGSEANTWALLNGALRPGGGARTLITTPLEHHSVLRGCEALAALCGPLQTALLPVGPDGMVDAAALPPLLAARPRLVSVQTANNEMGALQNIAALGAQCRDAGAWLHTDAVQAVGQIPLAMDAVDFLSASAHKFGGPKGIGFLYARPGIPLRPLICGGGQEAGVRGGTEPTALIVGMAAALKSALARQTVETARKRAMAADFCRAVRQAVPSARFNSRADGLPGLVSVTLPGRNAQELVYRLDLAGVLVSPGAACDNRGVKEPSHVLLALGRSPREALATLRFSFGRANEPGDGAEAARRLIAVLESSAAV